MGNQFVLHIVTGAPGSGKSTAVEASAGSCLEFLALDVDWLVDSASALVGKDVHFSSETWPAYNALWLDVMHSILRNRANAVLFAPFTPDDLAKLPAWCAGIRWLLLDCPDDVRGQRLAERSWNEDQIRDAIDDAAELRNVLGEDALDTSRLKSAEVAEAIARWVVRSGPRGR
jgi:hypothetical protein